MRHTVVRIMLLLVNNEKGRGCMIARPDPKSLKAFFLKYTIQSRKMIN